MSLALRAYLLAGGIALLGIAGQWSGGGLEHAWRHAGALFVLALTLDGLLAGRRRTMLARHMATAQFLGRAARGTLELHNPGARPLRIQTELYLPPELEAAGAAPGPWDWRLAPGSTEARTFAVAPAALGPIRLGPVYSRSLGPLGLAWWSRRFDLDDAVTVVPQALDAGESGTGSTRAGSRRPAPAAGSGAELLRLRDYRPGDPLHNIDWKATARSRRTTVRVMAEDQHLELVIAVDAGRSSALQAGALCRLHHYVNTASRLAELAIRHDDRVGLVAFADRMVEVVPPGRGLRTLRAIRAALARTAVQGQDANPLAATLRVRGMLRHRGLVVLLTELEEREAATQLAKAAALLVPKHTPLVASLTDPEIDAMRFAPPRRWLDPYRSYAALEYTRSLQATALALERMGASVVMARPERLDQAVLGRYRRMRERRRI